jgi:hypothetical protein
MYSRFAAKSGPVPPIMFLVGDLRIKYCEPSLAAQPLFTRPFAGLLLIESVMRVGVDRTIYGVIRIYLRVVQGLQPFLAFIRCTIVDLRR